jgi:hypothetical protein
LKVFYLFDILLSHVLAFQESYVDYAWHQLEERVQLWRERKKVREIEKEKRWWQFKDLRRELTELIADIQKDKIYLKYFVRKENQEINLEALRGALHQELEQILSYDRHLIALEGLKNYLKGSYEAKI